MIAALHPVVRGWGNFFRTVTCTREFDRMDDFVYRRLQCWMPRRVGQRQARKILWTADRAVRCAWHVTKIIGKLCAGKPHTPFEKEFYGNGSTAS